MFWLALRTKRSSLGLQSDLRTVRTELQKAATLGDKMLLLMRYIEQQVCRQYEKVILQLGSWPCLMKAVRSLLQLKKQSTRWQWTMIGVSRRTSFGHEVRAV